MLREFQHCFWIATLVVATCVASRAGDDVSFRNDVMAVLSKAGCNAGACHGNANGKGGFKLSLRGEGPERDFLTLTREMFGRRINPTDAHQSLILLKPTTQLAHEGGLRFKMDSSEYELLSRWIASGAKDDAGLAPKLITLNVEPQEEYLIAPTNRVQLRVTASFENNTKRDVSSLAVYELPSTLVTVAADGVVTFSKPGETTIIVRYLDQQVPVRLALVPSRPDFKWSAPTARSFIDEEIYARLRRLRTTPSEVCSDSEFVRRVYLDLTGLLPSASEAQAFVGSKRSDKRARIIDDLLKRPEFADFWALKWADLLRNEEKVLDRKGVQAFHRWIREAISTNKPLNEFAAELLTARGSSYENPSANLYRALRDPVKRSEAVAQVFLGARLQCAQCHNHPFDRWTQNDYYSWAAAFREVGYKVLENKRRDGLDSHEFNGEQIIHASYKVEVKNPRTGKPAKAHFLGETESAPNVSLAEWLANNPQFARAQVNRIWSYLMGRGLVDPIDDFRVTNPPSHPELLDKLTRDFVSHGFNLRHLVRLIANSHAYQLSSVPNDSNGDDVLNYSHVIPRRLMAEQLIDAQHQVLDVPTKFSGYPEGLRATQMPGVIAPRRRGPNLTPGDQMLRVFGKPQRILTCECERSNETSMSQAFQLIGSPAVNELLTRGDNRIGRLLDAAKPRQEIIEEFYWAALSRGPTKGEVDAALRHLGDKQHRVRFEDIAWALLNSKEFILRK